MEASGVVFRQTPCFSSSSPMVKELKPSSGLVLMGRRAGRTIRVSGFDDVGHLQYYSSSKLKSSYDPCSSTAAVAAPEMKIVKSDGQEGVLMATISTREKAPKNNTKKKLKKQLKLLKGLSGDLSVFSQMGSGLDSDRVKDKANVISDAAEILLEQLQKLKAEEKELKRKKKEEKARLKAAQKQNRLVHCEMSSSSSSESSDSECGEVVNMNTLKRAQTNQIATQPILEQALSPPSSPSTPIASLMQPFVSPEEKISLQSSSTQHILEKECRSRIGNSCTEPSSVCNGESINSINNSKKIEVCMGGKCRKSGAGVLLQEFERVVGIEGAVSGCKCMGKCRDGPNVRVLNGLNGGAADDSIRTPVNPLCIGVGLEDVDMIVANFLGEDQKNFSFAA